MGVATDFCIVVGLGKSGMSLVRYLAKQGVPFAVVDTRENPPGLKVLQQEYPDIEVHCGALDAELLCQAHTLYISPGVPLNNPAIQVASAHGVKLSGDIDLFSQKANAPIVAITGSNGKSTVTTLVGEMAKTAGLCVAVGGNLGEPALDLLQDDVELYVLELSSFQLETCQCLGAAVATLLNVSEDHMDRYDSIESYAQAKQRIFLGARQVVINEDDPQSSPDHVVNNTPLVFTTHIKQGVNGFKLESLQGDGWITFNGEPLIMLDQLKVLGTHNYANVMAALALGVAVNLPMAAMLKTLKCFTGLAHRCQWVGEYQGVNYYDDSKATNVGATLAAVEGIGNEKTRLILIMGGDGKGADFSPLAAPIEHYCRAILLIGRDAPIIEALLSQSMPRVYVNSMEEAVKQAALLAKAGDVVLLSPACSSLDMFKNFEERGHLFAKAVEALNEVTH